MKYLVIGLFLFFSKDLQASDWFQASSVTFSAVDVGSTTPVLFPSTTDFMVKQVEMTISNVSTFAAVFVSTSLTAASIRDDGTPIFKESQLTLRMNPLGPPTSFYFLREANSTNGVATRLRLMIRYKQ